MEDRPMEKSIERISQALVRVLAADAQILAEFHTWLQAESVRAVQTSDQQQENLLAKAAKELVEEAMLDERKLRECQSAAEIRGLLEKMLMQNAPASKIAPPA